MHSTEDPRHALRRARVAVTATFASHAVASGSLGPWIPRLKGNARLDASGLGIALTGFAVGLVIGTRLARPVLRLAGGRNVVRLGIPVLSGGLALLAFAQTLVALVAVFAAFGLASGLLDVAMNTEAVAVERRSGRRVMSTMHGTWSVSVFAGAAMGSIGLALGIPLRVHFPVVALALVAVSFPLLRSLPAAHEARDVFSPTIRADPIRSPTSRVVLLCLIAGAAFLSEGIAVDWTALYLRESLDAGAGAAGLGVAAFAAGMAASRFSGDRLSARIEPSRIVRVGASLGAIALATALAAGRVGPTIVALAIVGLAIGPVVPLAFRAAAAATLGQGRTALAVVVTSGYVGSIVGPLAVGFIADEVSLRAGFLVPVAMCGAAALAAGAIRERGP